MKHLVATLCLAALLTGCAYEPAEWYGIHSSTPATQHATDMASDPHGETPSIVSAVHGGTSTVLQGHRN